ncbi:sugar kinase [Azospirillum halopraeferens]|uniref:sugar kinase n=1 Tax=Azospirillum halopraeferens TaxID=34010 RepID=UPI0003FB1FB9|nr:sugar kinase [Azospirillum halopraeferens]
MKRIASIGECMVELQETETGSALYRQAFSGDTLNAAIYLHRALPEGMGRVRYVTALGDDAFSDRMVAWFAAEGLDTGLIERLPGRQPGLYVIILDERGERTFRYWRGDAAARHLLEDDAAADRLAVLADHDLVYLSGITLAILTPDARERLVRLLDRVRANGGAVAFDGNYRPRLWTSPEEAQEALTAVLRRATIGLPTHDDEALLFGDTDARATAERLHGLGVEEVVVKRGAEAALISAPGVRTWLAPQPVERVVDTTAAGDSFNGAYLAGRLAGLDPAAAAAQGHATAGRVVQVRGAILPR